MTDQRLVDDDADEAPDPGADADGADARGQRRPGDRPTPLDTWTRIQPGLAIIAMIGTFLSMPQAFAVALIGLVWVLATRFSRDRTFLGLTLTQALAWAATLVIAFLALAFVAYVLLPASR